MRKKILTIVLVVLALCSFFAACGGKEQSEEHDHSQFVTKVEAKDSTCAEAGNIEYYRCTCGKAFADVTAQTEISDESEIIVPKEPHAFDRQSTAEKYLKTSATCMEKAVYYYSCVCGEKGTETFEYGEKSAEHTLDDDGVCTVCDSVIEDTKGITYALSSDETYYSVTGYTGTATRVRIAESYNELPVTAIADSAFSNNLTITEVIIPSSVTSIGYEVFYNCSSLTSVTIGRGVTTIGQGAFVKCLSLTSVTIPDSVTSIGEGAFFDCYKLVEVINKSSLTITKGSYDNGNVAYYALNLKTEGASDIVNVNDYLFYTVDSTNYLLGYIGNGTDLVLPDNKGQNYEIYQYAFYGCSSLTSVTISDSVTSIGDYAFYNCRSITSITIPEGVTSISVCAFSGCSALTSVTIPDSVTSIKWSAFDDCSALTSVTIPDSVTSIKWSAFDDCSALTSVYYKGTETGWNNMSIDNDGNSYLTSAMRYYYSENNPFEGESAVEDGNYWHYDTDGKTPVVWTNN